jgi:hypothetical protein
MVAIQINNDQYLDLQNEFVGLNYQVFDLKNIETRQGTFTNDFSIPNTAHNQATLGYATIKNISDPTFSATQKIPARVYENNILISNGFVQINEFTKYNIDITFFGDNVDVFELLRDKSLVDIGDDIAYLRHEYTALNVVNSLTNDSGYIYLPIEYGLFGGREDMQISSGEIIPAIYITDIATAIFKGIGYKIDGTMLDRALYKKSVIPFTNDAWGYSPEFAISKSFYAYIGSSSTPDVIPISTTVKYNFKQKEKVLGGITYLSPLFDLSNDRWTVDVPVNIRINFTVDSPELKAVMPTLEIKKNGVTVSTIIGFTVAYNAVLAAGDYIEFYITNNDTVIPRAIRCTASGIVSKDLPFGGEIYPETLLPDMLQVDFVKWLMFRFASVMTVDKFSKTVYLNQFNDLKNNEVDDWSDKVDLSKEVKINYNELVANYGQRNIASYLEDRTDVLNTSYNSSNTTIFGSGLFEIDNDYIEKESDIYNAPFAGTFLYQSFGSNQLTLPYIPRYLPGELEVNIPTPRILTVYGLVDISQISNASSMTILGTSVDEIPFAYFYKSSLGFYVDNFKESLAFGIQNVPVPNDFGAFETDYQDMIRIFNKPEIVSCYLRINQIDLTNLNFLKKKYIEGLGGYFYLNLIDEYDGSGDSVRCELIKL